MKRVSNFVIPQGTTLYQLHNALQLAEEHRVKRVQLGAGCELEDGSAAILGDWASRSESLEQLDMSKGRIKTQRGYKHFAKGIKRLRSERDIIFPDDMTDADRVVVLDNL